MTLDNSTPNPDYPVVSDQECALPKNICYTSIPTTRLSEGNGSEILEIIDSTLGVGIGILDEDYRFKFINKIIYEQLQIENDELVVGDHFDKVMRLVCRNFDTPIEDLDKYHPRHVMQPKGELSATGQDLPLIKYPDGSMQKFVVKKLAEGQTICLNYDVSELHQKNNILKKSLDIGKAGYCNFDFRTKKYDFSESILKSVPTKLRRKIIQHGLWAFVHPKSVDALKKAYRDIPENQGKLNITFKTRNRLWIKAEGFAEKENGKWSVLRIFLRDVTESRQQKKEMEATKNQAIAATLAKSQFLANMSHEIRTPMNGVMGMAELLSRRDLDPEELRMVGIISRCAKSLVEIINDILDFSKIEADALELESTRVDIESMLSDIVGLLYTVASEKGIDLKLVIPIGVPRYFIGDFLRLRQVMLNIIGNALKFTETGSITISVKWNQDHHGKSQLKFSIIDTGIGMNEKTVAGIFEQFSQADNSTTRRYGGTGLGLSISKRIVELMGGTINVKSVPDKGSEFWVVLPLQPADSDNLELTDSAPTSTPLTAENDHRANPNPRRYRYNENGKVDILVAEDQELNRNVMKLMLAETRFAPVFANNGSEAVRKFSANPERYALILMDISMPVMDGIDATGQIATFEATHKLRHTPIIAVTGHSHKYTRDTCLEANMDDYMLKPLKRSILVPKLEHWIQAAFENDHETRSKMLQAS